MRKYCDEEKVLEIDIKDWDKAGFFVGDSWANMIIFKFCYTNNYPHVDLYLDRKTKKELLHKRNNPTDFFK